MADLTAILLVAGVGVLCNIAYFEYRLSRKQDKVVLKEKLVKLLLPLYYLIEDERQAMFIRDEHFDSIEHISEQPGRVRKGVAEVVKQYIYLADDELHKACITFLEWAYRNIDDNERFQQLMSGKLSDGNEFEDFKKVVERKYHEARNSYLQSKF